MLKLLKMFYCKNLNLISNWYVEITKSDFHASYCKIPNQNPKHNPILISNYYADPEHFKLQSVQCFKFKYFIFNAQSSFSLVFVMQTIIYFICNIINYKERQRDEENDKQLIQKDNLLYIHICMCVYYVQNDNMYF